MGLGAMSVVMLKLPLTSVLLPSLLLASAKPRGGEPADSGAHADAAQA
jgi:hypothetical protein